MNVRLAIVICVLGAVCAPACLGDIELQPPSKPATGGEGGEGGENVGAFGGGGGVEQCLTPPDGNCDEEADCECLSCAPAAACKVGGCMANGFCDLSFEDSCLCSDCDASPLCTGDLGGGHCTDDGTCYSSVESCACADCQAAPTCADNQRLCSGGAPDGTCSPMTESCGCTDCLGDIACLCETDLSCDFDEPCVCPDCWTDFFCSDPLQCVDDGQCNWEAEGCQCTDCAASPACM